MPRRTKDQAENPSAQLGLFLDWTKISLPEGSYSYVSYLDASQLASSPIDFYFAMPDGPGAVPTQQNDDQLRLLGELSSRLEEIKLLKNGWDGPPSIVPPHQTLQGAVALGNLIIWKFAPLPRSLNISAAGSGEILFTLFGVGGREAELWVGQAAPRQFLALLSGPGDELHEVLLSIDRVDVVAGWLRGEPFQQGRIAAAL